MVPVRGRLALDRFIRLPSRLQAADPAWVPPLRMERRDALSREKNPYFEHAEAAYWIARRDGRDVGRISAQEDRLAPPDADGTRPGHFGLLAAEDDPAVLRALLDTAENWLRARGLRRVLGPFSLSINEETGLLVDGFDTPPMLMMPHDAPHLGPRLEALGYAKARDVLAYRFDPREELPRGARAALARGVPAGVVLRPLRLAEYRGEIGRIVAIFNDAWSGNWGFTPLTAAELDHMATQMRPLIHERLVWIAEVHGEAAAFIVCLPNLNEAIRDLGGRLLPFGWARLLWRLRWRLPRTARVPLMGVRRAHASGVLGAMLPFLLIEALRREAALRGLHAVELSWILEDNAPMRRMIEALGAQAYKTYRIYEKALVP
ncbi:dATP pyrophosphohydrolase [Roseomonas sp. BN140053]|uniref:dATP pyrophosphohydrolase n=1 Tax=Roseomonas sp. BN140053 TaxID=3391898 RepID=UPI0039EA794C